jgi:hypothetical protein
MSKTGSGRSIMQDDDFFLESICRRFDAAIDRIDSRERSPTPRGAKALTQVLEQIKVENFERANELLNALNREIVASSLVRNSDRPEACVGPYRRYRRCRLA